MDPSDISYRGLGYVGFAAASIEGWQRFASEIVGLMPARIPAGGRAPVLVPRVDSDRPGRDESGTLFLKMDDRQWRVAVHPLAEGESEGLRYLGFELGSLVELERLAERLRKRGITVREASDGERAERCVDGLLVVHDPAGHRIELFSAGVRDRDFVSPAGMEFLTGALGLGHAVVYVPEIDEALAFYREGLGFERTDYMRFGPDGMGIHFLRCTRRHHSLALLQVGAPSGLQHLMFETTALDHVGRCLDRALAAKIPITSGLGRHRNDETVSFYMQGPSGFDVEIGWDGVLIDPDWVEHEFAGGGDVWGHHGLDAAALEPRGGEGQR